MNFEDEIEERLKDLTSEQLKTLIKEIYKELDYMHGVFGCLNGAGLTYELKIDTALDVLTEIKNLVGVDFN